MQQADLVVPLPDPFSSATFTTEVSDFSQPMTQRCPDSAKSFDSPEPLQEPVPALCRFRLPVLLVDLVDEGKVFFRNTITPAAARYHARGGPYLNKGDSTRPLLATMFGLFY